MGFTNTLTQMTDSALIAQIGAFVKHSRIQKNLTQAQLAERAGLNRWTLSQMENGESVTLASLIQIMRALDSLHVFKDFEVVKEISPLDYLNLNKKQKERVRNKSNTTEDQSDLGW